MNTARKLIVLGGGPVGLMAAIYARRNGLEAEVRSSAWPSPTDAATIESIPSQTMALLVETGIHPRTVGVKEIFSEQVRQWGTSSPTRKITAGRVHISRPELDVALFELAKRLCVAFVTERIERYGAERYASDGILVFDASGRSALSASAVLRPRRPIAGRQWLFERNGSTVATFGIGAEPSGYFYRMGNSRRVCVGVVGGGSFLRGDWREVRERLVENCEWLVDDLPTEFAEIGRSGATSMQWSDGSRGARPIGDASLAQDALSSQGLAVGLVDAVKSVFAGIGRPVSPSSNERGSTISRRRSLVAEIVATSPFANDPLWSEYLEFLRDGAETENLRRMDTDMHNGTRGMELEDI